MRKGGRRPRRLLALPLALGCFALLFGRSLAAPAKEIFFPELPDELAVPASDYGGGEYVFEAPEAAPSYEILEPVIAPAEEMTEITIKNKTGYEVDIETLMSEPLGIALERDTPQILIIHSHASEAYLPAGEDIYEPSDPYRTEETEYNMVRVGDELEEALVKRGFCVIHDRELYDYPSYTGSYTRSLEAIEKYLAENPGIKLVLDIHRDAVLTAEGEAYGTRCQVEGEDSAQIMLCVGTDEGGLEHPNWRENLKLALRLESEMNGLYPGLARPVTLSTGRYNQHATTGSLIVEVGYNGNTMAEALPAVRAFAEAAGNVFEEFF